MAHFAERYSLFVIICLGESIVAIGVGAAGEPLKAALLAAVSFGLLITIALWWTYFDRFAEAAETRLSEHDDPVLAAADAYSYLHLMLVAGIIVFAVGGRFIVHDASATLPDAARLTLCGGVALYLLGHLAVRWRLLETVAYGKAVAAALVMVVYAVGGGLRGWVLAGVIAVLLIAMCGAEGARER